MRWLAIYLMPNGLKTERRFFAQHLTHATNKAKGIAYQHGWQFVSVTSE